MRSVEPSGVLVESPLNAPGESSAGGTVRLPQGVVVARCGVLRGSCRVEYPRGPQGYWQGVRVMTPLVIFGAIALGLWGLDCWDRPYVICRRCKGRKRDWDAEEEHFGDVACRLCLRLGYRCRWELRWLNIF